MGEQDALQHTVHKQAGHDNQVIGYSTVNERMWHLGGLTKVMITGSRKEERKSNKPVNKPAATVRQGDLKCVFWKNESDNGPWYMADILRVFRNESGFVETTKVPAEDLLRVAFLANQALAELQVLKDQDRANRNEGPDDSPEQ